jgi:hypothetical protein
MKMMFAAVALAIAFPAAAHAQSAPAPAPTQAPAPAPKDKCCCEEMMKGHGDHAMGADAHAGHDMSQHQQQQK